MPVQPSGRCFIPVLATLIGRKRRAQPLFCSPSRERGFVLVYRPTNCDCAPQIVLSRNPPVRSAFAQTSSAKATVNPVHRHTSGGHGKLGGAHYSTALGR